jgi:hypothetical protein
MPRLLALAVALLACPLVASAHGLMMSDPKVKDGTVTVEVFYDDDTPGADAKMRVLNLAKEVVLEGTADAKGVWSFPALPPGDYVIRAKTTDGHAAKTDLYVPKPTDPPSEPPAGPTRADLTGPTRWLFAAGGVLLISVAFGIFYLFVRHRERRRATPE